MRARGIKYTEVPNGGTTVAHPWNTSGTYRGWWNYITNSASWNAERAVYRYADDTATWDGGSGGPDLVIMWLHGNAFAPPTLPATVWGHFFEQGQAAYGSSVVAAFQHPSAYSSYENLTGYIEEMVSWVKTRYGSGQSIVMGGHSAGGHLMAAVAQNHGYPWFTMSSALTMEGYNDIAPWSGPMDGALSNVGYTVENVGNKVDVNFTVDSPPGYMIWTPDDDVVNPDHADAVVAQLKNLGVDITYDEVSTTVTSGEEHIPMDGMNLDTFRDWMDRWR
jgi:predicted esterase